MKLSENLTKKFRTFYIFLFCNLIIQIRINILMKNKFISSGSKIVLILVAGLLIFSSLSFSNENDIKNIKGKNNGYKVIFDIPKLIGKNIDEVKNILGKPTGIDDEPTNLQLQKGMVEWEKVYNKNGYELRITYNAKTRKIIDFFVGTNDPSGTTKNYNDLLRICNLKKNSSKYSVRPVLSNTDKSKYTGIIIKINR